MSPCQRSENEVLERYVAGLPPEPHVESCVDCSAALKGYQSTAASLKSAATAYMPPGDWEAKVWARIQRAEAATRRPRWPVFAGFAATLAALAVFFVGPRGPEALAVLTSQVERGSGAVVRGGANPGGDVQSAAPGDVLHLVVEVPRGKLGDVRVYRGANELVFQCATSAACIHGKDRLEARVTLSRAGTYRTLVLAADQALPAPSGNLDADYAAAMRAGAAKESAPIDVL